MTPFALIFLVFFAQDAFMRFGFDTNLVLFGAGVVTAIPLLLFATSARRISYVMLGFIQYVGPTLMLILGVFVFHEAFDSTQLIAFLFIWAALLIFTISHLVIASKLKKSNGIIIAKRQGLSTTSCLFLLTKTLSFTFYRISDILKSTVVTIIVTT
ncbi:hypothetical protein PCORN_14099 [Listeria cornellensis FSL F6-0969]|uniref:RarD protein n=1 Tax=Listeria cornellensis FSL F6-0969 TaxID=1265820 RepID=W7BP73_9LIST|nr:hypothetical protein PCORN_14099 [Listeria cornellensis FSL F6-0969]